MTTRPPMLRIANRARKRYHLVLAALLAGNPLCALDLKSPDGKLTLSFEVKDMGAARACPVYRVSYDGRPVLADSRLGLELDHTTLASGLELAGHAESQQDTSWKPVCGERELIRDNFRELSVDLKRTSAPGLRMRITFRAYDAGIAYAYTLPAQDGLTSFVITSEASSFAFGADHKAWAVYRAQGSYDRSAPRRRLANVPCGEVRLSEIQAGAERPLTVRLAGDLYAAVTEAKCVDYARMKLQPAPDAPFTLKALLDGEGDVQGSVTGITPFSTPWRVVMVADSPGKLLENNSIIPTLNAPCAMDDISWIKPGKVIRETTLTTAGGKACVDFAVKRGLQYVEYDAGWYGDEHDPQSDARAVHLDPKRNPVPDSLNLRDAIDYANSKGIGVILYVNHVAMERQLDEILPLYESWGVKGVKYGFVSVGSQHWTKWLHDAIRKAAAHHLMVDIHDEFRDTGYRRTYPNLMTVEGIAGNEEFPTPVHNATVPFTRYLTGPADYTFCWYDKRLRQTHAHQLAISTIFFSPWQFLYWYDRPAAWDGDPALAYWDSLPTTWDETRVLKGEIGKCVSVARRKGADWYVGSILADGSRKLDIPLSFLEAGKKFRATVFADRFPDNQDAKDVMIVSRVVDRGTVLHADLSARGGHAVRIVPAAP